MTDEVRHSYPKAKLLQVGGIHECRDVMDTTVSIPFIAPSDFDGIESATIELHANTRGTLFWSPTVFINEYKELSGDRLVKGSETPITEGRNKLDVTGSFDEVKADDVVLFVFARFGTSAYDTLVDTALTLRLNLFYHTSPTTAKEDEEE